MTRASAEGLVAVGITKCRDVCGGSACILNTRIPVWSLEAYRRLGSNDFSLLVNFPTIGQSDLDNAWQYVATHWEEIEREIVEQALA